MIPLLQRRRFAIKWFLPYAVLVCILAWHFREAWTGEDLELLTTAAVIGLIAAVVMFFVIRRQSKEEPDEVLDGGSFIRVSYGGESEDIAISNVRAVETLKLVRITRVYLLVRTPSKFGEVISFYPLQEKDQNGKNAVAASLCKRVDAQASDAICKG